MTLDDRMEKVGFPNTNTGGGCRAYHFVVDDDADRAVVDKLLDHVGDLGGVARDRVRYILVAHPEGCWVPASLDEAAIIAFQDEDSDELLIIDTTLRDILGVLEGTGSARPAARAAATSSRDLDAINAHRRSIGMVPLDPVAAGWSDDDVATEARRLRGRNPTPRAELLAW